MKAAFGPYCFYCNARLPDDSPVDHVLPWSRFGIDGIANLVLACRRCNGNKLNALPSLALISRGLARNRIILEHIAETITWPTQYDRVVSLARGIYRSESTR